MISDSTGRAARVRRPDEAPRHLRLAPEPLSGSTRLPAQPTALIGRAADVAALRAMLWRIDVRLLTLTGPGGIGKTRLAIAVAAEVAADFTDGVCFVDLAPLTDPALVPDAIHRALGLRGRSDRPAQDQVREALRDRDLLLLLDNFEHLAGAARVVAELLAACPALVILVTSRTPLRLRWEHQYRVAPLPAPVPASAAPGDLAANPAVALFLDRASTVVGGLSPSTEDLAAIAAICARLDGLPLAIEMAAAQAQLFSPRALARRLGERLDLLRSDFADHPERHRSLAATIAWSHDLLGPAERTVFRRLAVFADGCTIAAAGAVCGAAGIGAAAGAGATAPGGPEPSAEAGEQARGEVAAARDDRPGVAQVLDTLVGHSLLFSEEDADGEPRFRMLTTIREYAAARLNECGELPDCQRRLAEYLLGLAARAAPELTGPQQVYWLQVLARERENYRAALTWTIAAGQPALGQRLGAALWWDWYLRGDFREGHEWLARLLALPGEAEPAAHAGCLLGAGAFAYQLGEPARAQELGAAGLALARTLQDRDLTCLALNLVGGVALSSGALARAHELYGAAVAQFRQEAGQRALLPREQFGLSLSLTNLGAVSMSLGDPRGAVGLLEESLALTRRLGDRQGTAHALARLAEAVEQAGDRSRAQALIEEALALFGELGDRWGLARAQLALGRLALARRDLERAAQLLGDSLRYFAHAELRLELAFCWETIANLALLRGHAERAARLLGAAAALRASIGSVPESIERAERERLIAATAAALGTGRAAAARQTGATFAPEASIAEALAEIAASPPVAPADPAAPGTAPPVPPDPAAALTRRERELLPCLARGLSNRAIAEELRIGTRTVEMHVANLRAKLGLNNRAQIAAWAASHGLAAGLPPED